MRNTQPNGDSYTPAISQTGRYTVYAPLATNLVAGDSNGWADIFLYDRNSGGTERISIDSAGFQANGETYQLSASNDGLLVAFVTRRAARRARWLHPA